jgi:hypothetical protein
VGIVRYTRDDKMDASKCYYEIRTVVQRRQLLFITVYVLHTYLLMHIFYYSFIQLANSFVRSVIGLLEPSYFICLMIY